MAWCTSRHDKSPCLSPRNPEVLSEALRNGPFLARYSKGLPLRNTSPRLSRNVQTTGVSTKRRAVGYRLRNHSHSKHRRFTSASASRPLGLPPRTASLELLLGVSASDFPWPVELVEWHTTVPPVPTQPPNPTPAFAFLQSGLPLHEDPLGSKPGCSTASSPVVGLTEEPALPEGSANRSSGRRTLQTRSSSSASSTLRCLGPCLLWSCPLGKSVPRPGLCGLHQWAPANPSSSRHRRKNSVRRLASTVDLKQSSTQPQGCPLGQASSRCRSPGSAQQLPVSIDRPLACQTIVENRS